LSAKWSERASAYRSRRLLNCIKAGAVPTFQKRPRGQPGSAVRKFAEMENLLFFLRACRATFGLRETQLFTTDDLQYGVGLRTVAVTLYWLGRAAFVMGFRGPQLNLAAFVALTCSVCRRPILPSEKYVVTADQQFHSACCSCAKVRLPSLIHSSLHLRSLARLCLLCAHVLPCSVTAC
jgi:hypothetical protein